MEGKSSAQNTQIGRFSNPYLPIDIEFRAKRRRSLLDCFQSLYLSPIMISKSN